jgi:histidine ammonia-lyase
MLDGRHLTAAQVVAAARPGASGAYETVLLDAEARERLAATRAFIDSSWMRDDAPLVYAFNTGVGSFKDARIPVADMAEYQRRLILAHAACVGQPLPEDVVRATMILRANAFASNHSGARVLVLDRLLGFLNAGLHPDSRARS